MKILSICCLISLAACTSTFVACPTCIGTVTQQSAPFFSDECYLLDQNKVPPEYVAQNIIGMPEPSDEEPATDGGKSNEE